MIQKVLGWAAARPVLDWNTKSHEGCTKLYGVRGRAAAPRVMKTDLTTTVTTITPTTAPTTATPYNFGCTPCDFVRQSNAVRRLRSNESSFRYLFVITLSAAGLLTACTTEPPAPPVTTFYHWETELNPSPTARRLLDSLRCDRLYVKVFDLSVYGGGLVTSANVVFNDTAKLPQLVPVVFITNEVFTGRTGFKPAHLADQLLDRLRNFPHGYPELQIDCDWTAGTQVRYFGFLSEVKKRLPTNVMLSCTVRLHQYRDRRVQGIPPVDRATLMAYNTGRLDDWATGNSIYDSTVVNNYLADQPDYPLDLDVAVAAYDWAAVYRRDELVYLLNEPDPDALSDTSRFGLLSSDPLPPPPTGRSTSRYSSFSHRYYVKRSTYLNGNYLYRGDLLRHEVVPPATVPVQSALLQRYVKSFPGQRLLVFRLGSRLWK